MRGTQTRFPVGGGLSPSGVARWGRSCRATWRKALKRKSRTPSSRVVLGGAEGAEAQHLLVPESPEVPPYRCGVV